MDLYYKAVICPKYHQGLECPPSQHQRGRVHKMHSKLAYQRLAINQPRAAHTTTLSIIHYYTVAYLSILKKKKISPWYHGL